MKPLTERTISFVGEEKYRDFLKPINFHNRLVRYFSRICFSKLFFDKNQTIENSLMILGTGRSGTTWLSELLADYLHYRIIAEPFHPGRILPHIYKKYITDRVYLPPDFYNEDFTQIMGRLLSGKLTGPRMNRVNFIVNPKGRLVKFTNAAPFIEWLHVKYPSVRIVLVLRHPLAVAGSRANLKGNPVRKIDRYLSDPVLVSKFLSDKLGVINNAQTRLQKQAVLWAIENYMILNTLKTDDVFITSYEYLVTDLGAEMKKLMEYIQPEVKFNPMKITNITSASSKITTNSANIEHKLSKWQNRLSDKEIDDVLEILEAFGLNHIYDSNYMIKLDPREILS